MSDPHLNVFHAYRGPTKSDEAAVHQLEDNLTRALVITLNLIRNTDARQPLLAALKFPSPGTQEPYQCYLQVNSANPDWPPPAHRYLLVIHGGPTLSRLTQASSVATGRVDAVIASDNFVVAIESKLSDQITREQLQRHKATLGIGNPDELVVTWTEIARATRAILIARPSEPTTQFILEQFEEYLRMNGFGGITEQHFAYFAQTQENRDPLVKDGIHRVLNKLGTSVRQSLGPNWTMRRLNINAGALGAGAVVEPIEGERQPHLTIEIHAAGLTIFGNIELAQSYKQFIRAWKEQPGGLIEIIRKLGNEPIASADDVPWRLRIFRRVPLGRPRLYHYWLAADITLNTLSKLSDELIHDVVTGITAIPGGEAAPQISLGRDYPASLLLNDDHLSERLISDARRLEPFFNWL